MKRIYVMGAMSSPNPLQFLDNLRRGMKLSTEILLAGYACFSPFIDFQLFFQLQDGEHVPVDVIKASSMKWLEVSDAGLLVPGWEGSKGTEDELKRAEALQIPIFHSLDDLKREMPPCGKPMKEKSGIMNYCDGFNISCPYKLSDDSPIPCVGTWEQCNHYRGHKVLS